MTPVDISEQWREDWSSASVVNNVLITDPIIWHPAFDLPHRSWSLLNHFQTGQGRCLYNLHTWDLASSDLCMCGQQQTRIIIRSMCVHSLCFRWTAIPTWSRWYVNPLAGVYCGYSTRQMKNVYCCYCATCSMAAISDKLCIVVTVQRVAWLLLVSCVQLLMRLSRWLSWQRDDTVSRYHLSTWRCVFSL